MNLYFIPVLFFNYNAHEPVYQLLADAFYKIGVLSPMEQTPKRLSFYLFFNVLSPSPTFTLRVYSPCLSYFLLHLLLSFPFLALSIPSIPCFSTYFKYFGSFLVVFLSIHLKTILTHLFPKGNVQFLISCILILLLAIVIFCQCTYKVFMSLSYAA